MWLLTISQPAWISLPMSSCFVCACICDIYVTLLTPLILIVFPRIHPLQNFGNWTPHIMNIIAARCSSRLEHSCNLCTCGVSLSSSASSCGILVMCTVSIIIPPPPPICKQCMHLHPEQVYTFFLVFNYPNWYRLSLLHTSLPSSF